MVIAGIRLGDILVVREFVIVACAVLLLLIIVLVIALVRRSRWKKRSKQAAAQESSSSINHAYETGKIIAVTPKGSPVHMDEGEKTIDVYGGNEETINPYGNGDGEETINPYGAGEETIAPDWSPKTVVRFEVDEQGERVVREVSFSDKMEIGRDTSCQLILKAKYVSRHHVELRILPDGVFMHNLSAEKTERYTLLNHAELGDALEPVNSGDVLEIAQTMIRITILSKA